jgi:DNA primase
VVLLPEGEDPDSFAKKNNANQFIDYIKQHQQDFIQFKSALLLQEAGSDPIKKAQLINDIVQSIAVIPNQIVRSVYIQECAERFAMRESLLGEAVQRARQQKQQEKAPAPAPSLIPEQVSTPIVPIEPQVVQQESAPLPYTYAQEQVIMRYIINDGKKELQFPDAETGEQFCISLVNYVAAILEQDSMHMQYPIHNRLLEEAIATPETNLRHYFLNHSDVAIQNYTFALVEDKYENCRNAKDWDNDQYIRHLSQVMPQVVLEFKLRTVKGQLNQIAEQIKKAHLTEEEAMAAMREQMRLTKLQQDIMESLRESKIFRSF